MIEWLTDTLLMTGVFLALVLLVRRPVGRWFGAGAAYALWALPMIRLALPPLALPRGVLPEFGIEQITAAATAATAPVAQTGNGDALAALAVPGATTELAALSTAPALPAEPSLLEQIPWSTLALAVWLGGAMLFLAWRTYSYRAMRRDLLDGARQVATHGDVRIIESPAASAPLAFGVFDKVIALPKGFLAEVDSETSDLAIAHELEHHAGSDLLALMAMQPLFALHWFNPLAWAAWRAVRSDQEAACDARVMAGRGGDERAVYGRLIASFAGGRRLALIAPMAGPLSGDKPIIHRLKALGRKDVTTARRALGRGMFAVAVITVPVTATVSYAAMEETQDTAQSDVPGTVSPVPNVPVAPTYEGGSGRQTVTDVPDAPEAPEPPAAPEWNDLAAVPAPPEAPLPPAPPAPQATASTAARQQAFDAREARRRQADARRMQADVRRMQVDARRMAANANYMKEDTRRMVAEAMARVPRVEETVSADGKRRTIRMVSKDENGQRAVVQEMVLDESCPIDERRGAPASHGGPGASTVVCTGAPKVAMTATVNALRSARASIASDRNLDAQVRAQVLADLDSGIADVQREAHEEND
jgi:Antirepressor regulating drug resistance, predicted signal transduction N-terminal membrane component